MTTEVGPAKPPKLLTGANWLAGLVIPLGILAVCVAADLSASERLTSDVGRTALLYVLAALVELLVIISIVPWWSAGLVDRHSFGAVIAAFRVATMVLSTSLLLLVLGFLQDSWGFASLVKVQTVVLCVGLLAAGLAAFLQGLLRRVTGAALVTMLLGFGLISTPFWGNILVQCAGDAWRSWAIGVVVKATPISACSSAVGYDLFRGRVLYVLSAVSDYRYALPEWWTYATVTGTAAIVLIELATLIRRQRSP